jgi:hypothetical protein
MERKKPIAWHEKNRLANAFQTTGFVPALRSNMTVRGVVPLDFTAVSRILTPKIMRGWRHETDRARPDTRRRSGVAGPCLLLAAASWLLFCSVTVSAATSSVPTLSNARTFAGRRKVLLNEGDASFGKNRLDALGRNLFLPFSPSPSSTESPQPPARSPILQPGGSQPTSSNTVGSRRRSTKAVELSASEAASASTTASSSSRGTTLPRSSYSAAQQQRERWLSSATHGPSYHPPWNPSSEIETTTGFLQGLYSRYPAEFEKEVPSLAKSFPVRTIRQYPARIRQGE